MKENAPIGKIGWKDILKGVITSVLTIVVSGIVTSLNNGKMPDMATIQPLLLTGLASGAGYILKNVLTNSDDQFLKKEN